MNKYYLYLETVENEKPFDIIYRELIDIYNAENIEDCLKETGWQGLDAESNEQYCIDEKDEDCFDLGYYYPFGEAKVIDNAENSPKYSDSVMRRVRQALGCEPDDTSCDEAINDMDQMDVFNKWLQWEGILGYTYKIKEAVDNIFYGK